MLLEDVFSLLLLIQFFHSIEELSTNFYERFPVFRMSFRFFLFFELIFSGFWIAVWFVHDFPFRIELMTFFTLLMFANGIWHIAWFLFCEKGKRYIPGLITAPFHVIVFSIFYFSSMYRLM